MAKGAFNLCKWSANENWKGKCSSRGRRWIFYQVLCWTNPNSRYTSQDSRGLLEHCNRWNFTRLSWLSLQTREKYENNYVAYANDVFTEEILQGCKECSGAQHKFPPKSPFFSNFSLFLNIWSTYHCYRKYHWPLWPVKHVKENGGLSEIKTKRSKEHFCVSNGCISSFLVFLENTSLHIERAPC